jgi:hypothetical protein
LCALTNSVGGGEKEEGKKACIVGWVPRAHTQCR